MPTIKLPFNDDAGKFDAGSAIGFAAAVLAAIVILRAVPITAKLVK